MRSNLSNASVTALLNTKQVAHLLGIHPTTLRLARSRQSLALPHVRIGGAIRYRLSDVERFIQANTFGANQ